MPNSMKIVLVVENTAEGRDILGEHGLAYWIEADGRKILFDTGQGHILLHNADVLGIDLRQTETLVISHGHFDHAGGLAPLFEVARPALFVAHPEIFSPKYTRHGGEMMEIGMGTLTEDDIRSHCEQLRLSREPVEIVPGVSFLGEIPRRTSFEDTGGAFFADAEGRSPDPLNDDSALVLESIKGLVVLLGCTHSGVVNTLMRVGELFAGKKIAAVIGGMHLWNASARRLDETVEAIRQSGAALVAAGHCTGWRATKRFADEFGDRFEPLAAGRIYKFE